MHFVLYYNIFNVESKIYASIFYAIYRYEYRVCTSTNIGHSRQCRRYDFRGAVQIIKCEFPVSQTGLSNRTGFGQTSRQKKLLLYFRLQFSLDTFFFVFKGNGCEVSILASLSLAHGRRPISSGRLQLSTINVYKFSTPCLVRRPKNAVCGNLSIQP